LKNDPKKLGFVTGDREQTETGSIPAPRQSSRTAEEDGGHWRIPFEVAREIRRRVWRRLGPIDEAVAEGKREGSGRAGEDGWRAVVSANRGEMCERLSSSRISLVVKRQPFPSIDAYHRIRCLASPTVRPIQWHIQFRYLIFQMRCLN
jgi:hypothetical protein